LKHKFLPNPSSNHTSEDNIQIPNCWKHDSRETNMLAQQDRIQIIWQHSVVENT
jgi:hypothetical protein